MKRRFKDINFRSASLDTIEKANEIIKDYAGQGLKLTLRQLYYQFVSKNLLPNTERSYKNLGSLINDGRMAGLVDWDAIEDRIREPVIQSEWSSLESLAASAVRAYRLPRWDGQENYVELWVEKSALAGVLEPLASEFHVTLMVNRGYCVDPKTKILTADLRWVEAAKIKAGDELIGVDEHVPGFKKHRRLRQANVEGVCRFQSPRVRVVTDHGTLIVSDNHPFLATRMNSAGDNWHGYVWQEASTLRRGQRIARICSPWEPDDSREAGWLAGMYDGEGCLPKTRNSEIDIYQLPGLVSDQLRKTLTDRGWLCSSPVGGKSGVIVFRTSGIDRLLTLLGTLRPLRLLAKFRKLLLAGRFPSKSKQPATIKKIERLPSGPVIGIETDTRTLITEGLVSHNSSASAMYESAQRFMREGIGKNPILFYLGDHDPSGEDMVRDVRPPSAFRC